MSDINVGQISEALNDKMDRDAHVEKVKALSAEIVERYPYPTDPITE